MHCGGVYWRPSVQYPVPFRTIHRDMPRTDIYIKVEVDHDKEETADAIGSELVRQLKKLYVVRRAEVTNHVRKSED